MKSAAIPSTSPMFAMLLPMSVPVMIAGLFDHAATNDVLSSGREVAKAMNVAERTAVLMCASPEMFVAASTKRSDPFTNNQTETIKMSASMSISSCFSSVPI